MHLKVKICDENIKHLYNNRDNHATDSGFDLYVVKDITIPSHSFGFKIDFQIQCSPEENHGYDLVPRSSISKTPLRMSNSIGIIDQDYRGNIIAAIDNFSDEPYVVSKGQRLFQIVAPDRAPINIKFVDELTETSRGTGGFGSTG